MTIDLTRRTLLQLAGATSLAMAAAGAARAEGTPQGGGPTYASRTPMRVGMVTLRVKNLDKVADYYRDVIGLTVMERSATRRQARHGRHHAAGAGGPSRCRDRAAQRRRPLPHRLPDADAQGPRALAGACRLASRAAVGLCRSPRQRIRLSRRSRRQRHRGLCRPRSLAMAVERGQREDGGRRARHSRPAVADQYARARLCQGAGRPAHRPHASARRRSRAGAKASTTARSASTRPAAATAPRSCRRAAITITSA